jgi:predicted dehydrogenase
MLDRKHTQLSNVAVIGGGRWARTYVRVLHEQLPRKCKITILSRRNATGMLNWVNQSKLSDRVRVVSDWTDLFRQQPRLAFVVNAAADHLAAAQELINAGVATLVEKPLAMSASQAQLLLDLASRRRILLGVAHVLMFSAPLLEFARCVREAGDASALSLIWTDERGEIREGEVKSYDPRLTVVRDLMPHVDSILSLIQPTHQFVSGDITVDRGGAAVELDCMMDSTRCRLQLQRASPKRARIINAVCTDDHPSVDFTEEPGFVISQSKTYSVLSKDGLRPLGSMLKTFINAAIGGPLDSRLDPALGLKGCRISDDVETFYQAAQLSWLKAKAIACLPDEKQDAFYAIQELLAYGPSIAEDASSDTVERTWAALKSPRGDAVFQAMADGTKLRDIFHD